MASNNYTSANIVPSSDTFREWVDLTNRITYDMEKIVVTVTANSQGACTVGNSYVDGAFSANTLAVTGNSTVMGVLKGTKATNTVYGSASVLANLHISSNTVHVQNSTVNAVFHSQSDAYFTAGIQVTTNSTVNAVTINTTADTFESNAGTNKFNTVVDINANVDIDNGLTTITSTNTVIENGELNITSNGNIDAASVDIAGGELTTSSNVTINSTATTFTSNAVTNILNSNTDINANVDIDAAQVTIDGGNLIVGSILDQNANVDIDAEEVDIAGGELQTSSNVTINSTATTFTSNAVTNILNSNTDINANVDIDNDLTTITSANTVIENGELNLTSNVDFDADSFNIGSGQLTVSSNVNITSVNTTIGDASTDLLTVNANTTLTDELNVQGDVDLDAALNVDGATTLNGDVDIGNAITDTLSITSKVDTNIIPSANGTKSIGNTTLRWDGTFDDLVGEDITANNDLTVTADATVGANLDVNGQFSVATSSFDTIRTTVTGGGSNVRTIVLGDTTTSNTDFDRLVVTGGVGNTDFGLMPLHGNNILLGNATNRWIFSANTIDASGAGSIDGDITAGADVDITAEANTNTLRVRSTSAMADRLTISSGGASITGPLDTVNNANVGGNAAVVGVLSVTNTAALGNTTITGFVNATTSGQVGTTLTVGGNTSISGNLAVTGLSTLTGNTTLSEDLSVAGNTTLTEVTTMNANVSLGGATTDVISYTGRVNTSLEPSANGKVLGHASRRWAAALTTANTTGDITAGGDVDITGEVNAASGVIVGDLDVGDDITLANTSNIIFSNTDVSTSQVEISSNNITVPYLQVQNQVTLPTDTIITAASLDAANGTITNNLTLTGATAGAANSVFKIGNGANTVSIEFANAEANGHLLAKTTNTSDIGSAAKSFRTGYFDTSVVVGDTVANTTALLANFVYAKEDLVANYSSDQQLKDNVLKIDTALDKVEALGGYSFTWNNNIEDHRAGTHDYGVIAQELEDVLPHAVDINSRGYKTVNYNSLIPLLIEAVKELSARVKELEPEQEDEEDIDG